MDVWPVIVEGWQHECCGSAFELGEEVKWTLAFEERPDVATAKELRADLRYAFEDRIGDAFVISSRGLTAAWTGPDQLPLRGVTSGLLREDHHEVGPSSAMRATVGVVTRIRLVNLDHDRRVDGR